MTNDKINREYVEAYTNASLLVREDFTFEDGLFSGYDAENRTYHKSTWNYQFGQNGYGKRDVTLQDARCVWNLLKAHVSRYTPDVVENICGTPQALLPGQVNYWSNYPKFFVSMMKSFYGDKAQKENGWGFDWLPKWDKSYDVFQYFDMMSQGKVNGYIC